MQSCEKFPIKEKSEEIDYEKLLCEFWQFYSEKKFKYVIDIRKRQKVTVQEAI